MLFNLYNLQTKKPAEINEYYVRDMMPHLKKAKIVNGLKLNNKIMRIIEKNYIEYYKRIIGESDENKY